MTTLKKPSAIGFACMLACALAACGGSGSGVDDQSAVTPPSVGDIGYLNLSVSDAPIKDATKVCIRFDGVELKHADSDEKETIDFDEPEVVNLLANQGANSHPIVTNASIPAGQYEWIRLKVQAERGLGAVDGDPGSELCESATENSYLVRNSSEVHSLFIPSGSQRGLQLIKDIVIPTNRSGDYTAEWDLGKSFNGPPGLQPDVMMKPVVKLVANNEVGTLVGQVADELVALDSCDAEFAPSVYVFDDGVAPNPFDDPFAADDAVATGLVEQQEQEDGSMPWRYSIGFLLAGNYEAAFTCNGTDFAPLAGKPAEILVDEVTAVDFLAEDAAGTLTGQVDSVFFDPEAPESGFCDTDIAPVVYVFGEGVEPDFAADPIAIGEVAGDMSNGYGYSIPLQAGNYNAAFACSGTAFIPAAGKPAEILPASAATVDFVAEDAPPPVGSLSGTVAVDLVGDASCTPSTFDAAVYVFEKGVTPNTTDTPVATGTIVTDVATEPSVYSIADLVAGTYTAAFTCNGGDFVPVAGKEAVIKIGEDTPVSFDAADAP